MGEFAQLGGFSGDIVMVGCGSIGQATLPLILRHLGVTPDRITIVTADGRGREEAAEYGIAFREVPLTQDNHRQVLEPLHLHRRAAEAQEAPRRRAAGRPGPLRPRQQGRDQPGERGDERKQQPDPQGVPPSAGQRQPPADAQPRRRQHRQTRCHLHQARTAAMVTANCGTLGSMMATRAPGSNPWPCSQAPRAAEWRSSSP